MILYMYRLISNNYSRYTKNTAAVYIVHFAINSVNREFISIVFIPFAFDLHFSNRFPDNHFNRPGMPVAAF